MTIKLNLTCRHNREDVLSVETHDAAVRVGITYLRHNEACVVLLDEGSARELFNWLGVWLHGGNR